MNSKNLEFVLFWLAIATLIVPPIFAWIKSEENNFFLKLSKESWITMFLGVTIAVSSYIKTGVDAKDKIRDKAIADSVSNAYAQTIIDSVNKGLRPYKLLLNSKNQVVNIYTANKEGVEKPLLYVTRWDYIKTRSSETKDSVFFRISVDNHSKFDAFNTTIKANFISFDENNKIGQITPPTILDNFIMPANFTADYDHYIQKSRFSRLPNLYIHVTGTYKNQFAPLDYMFKLDVDNHKMYLVSPLVRAQIMNAVKSYRKKSPSKS